MQLTPRLAASVCAALLALPVAGLAQQPAKPPIQLPLFSSPRPPSAPPAPVPPAARHAALTEQLNQNTVTVISGNPNGTYLYLAYDMSAVLDEGNDLRVLPVIGKGGYQNVMDVLHLKGVDLCITQANIMTTSRRPESSAQHR